MKINNTDSLKSSVASLLSISHFFFQLFDHEGNAEVTLRNTGKIGFKFNIIHPEDEEEADEEAGREMKALEEQNEEDVRPGRLMVIPTMVSSSWYYFRCGRVIYYVQ